MADTYDFALRGFTGPENTIECGHDAVFDGIVLIEETAVDFNILVDGGINAITIDEVLKWFLPNAYVCRDI